MGLEIYTLLVAQLLILLRAHVFSQEDKDLGTAKQSKT